MNKNMEKVKHLLSNYKYSIEYAGMNGRNSLILHITGDKLIEFLNNEFSLFVNYRDPDNIHIDTNESCIVFLYNNEKSKKSFNGSYFVTIPRSALNSNHTFYIGLSPLFGICNNILFFNDIKDLKQNIYEIDELPYNYDIENEIWNLDVVSPNYIIWGLCFLFEYGIISYLVKKNSKRSTKMNNQITSSQKQILNLKDVKSLTRSIVKIIQKNEKHFKESESCPAAPNSSRFFETRNGTIKIAFNYKTYSGYIVRHCCVAVLIGSAIDYEVKNEVTKKILALFSKFENHNLDVKTRIMKADGSSYSVLGLYNSKNDFYNDEDKIKLEQFVDKLFQ